VERTFGQDEIIVSKTDPKGIIRYANDVFLRVSCYTEAELIGKPHNIIRHPDMPRGVFKLMWDTIAAGDEIFAYVVNLAADGAHYWVFAHVTPSYDAQGRLTGYHSNRRSPDRGAVRQIEDLYAVLRREEQRAGRGHASVEASVDHLERLLRERRVTYDEFVWSLTPA
jgi:PAS domain S-box-containing protein